MGSRKDLGDLDGLELRVIEDLIGGTETWFRCMENVDGSGFYNCDGPSGKVLAIR